jgi:hypothetical protein
MRCLWVNYGSATYVIQRSCFMSEGLRKWSEVSEEEATAFRRDPVRRVAALGAALIGVGCFGVVANIFLTLAWSTLSLDQGPVQRPAGMDQETFEQYQHGRGAAPLLNCMLVSVPTLAVYPLVIVGGLRMRDLRRRGSAMTGAILAMLPCGPAFLFGLPVGVWALAVLSDPAVRAAFDRRGRHD